MGGPCCIHRPLLPPSPKQIQTLSSCLPHVPPVPPPPLLPVDKVQVRTERVDEVVKEDVLLMKVRGRREEGLYMCGGGSREGGSCLWRAVNFS